MKKFVVLAGFVGLSALSAVAFAEANGQCEHGGKGEGRGFGMMHADANKDGKVTIDEALTAGKARFAAKDANKDGVLTKDELGGRGEWLFERADANKDGKLTAAESEAFVRAGFTRFDANKDGVLTADEMPHGHHGHHGDRDPGNK
jgi:hypothetical protein